MFHCAHGGDGEVYLRQASAETLDPKKDEPQWRFTTNPHSGLLFNFLDKSNQSLLTVTRQRGLPFSKFVMVANGKTICTIRQHSLFLNRYSLSFQNGGQWNLHFLLFSIFGKGVSETGSEIRIIIHRYDWWEVGIDAKADNLYLVAALALLHRERHRFS